jgi:hypothetical protein
MTATTTPSSPVKDGFFQLVHAEWTKFRTVRGWVIGMLVAILLTVLVGLLGPAGSEISCSGPGGRPCDHSLPTGPGGEAVHDRFTFVHRSLDGDGSITARVTSLTGKLLEPGGEGPSALQPWSKAGIMMKAGTGEGASYAAVRVTGANGVRMQHDFTGDIAGPSGDVSVASPKWLRLTKSGDKLTGYASADGVAWTEIGTVDAAGLRTGAEAGLFAASPGFEVVTESFASVSGTFGPTQATAIFDNVDVQGARAQAGWASDLVGADAPMPNVASGFTEADGRFTVSGSGDIAPAVESRGSAARTIEDGLAGVFAGLIPVIVVATLFTTAEYRRGLIQTTFAASPRRGRVLAAKAVVLGGVTFVTGLIGAALTVPAVQSLEQAKGLFLYPVSTWTELRVIAGTAALFAVVAVLALAVGTLLRRSAGAVTAVMVAIILPYVLAIASVLPSGAAQWLTRLTPAAGFAVQQSLPEYSQVAAAYTPVNGYFPLSPLGGFAVLCCYAALALGFAVVLLRRRDV